MADIPAIKPAAASVPRSTCLSCSSHSAVSAGDLSVSGRTANQGDACLRGHQMASAVFQGAETLGYGASLHRGNPKALYRLFTVAMCVHKTKNQLTFAPGVGGADHSVNVLAGHEAAQDVELFFLVPGHDVLPAVGQDGQIIPPPLGVFPVVSVGRSQFHQMADASGNDAFRRGKTAVPFDGCP